MLGKLGSVEAVNHMLDFFEQHVDMIKRVDKSIVKFQGDMWSSLIPLFYSIIDSSETISFLTEKGKLRDVYIIARTVFETTVNTCFICSKGDTAALKAKRHAQQKTYRDYERELEINSKKLKFKWKGKDYLSITDELKSALQEFTTKSGKEVSSWTPETVKDRIQIIAKKYGDDVGARLQFGLFSIYRHASEIAHGTLFGALFILGYTDPKSPTSSDDLRIRQLEYLSIILLMLGLSLSALLFVVEGEMGTDELTKVSTELLSLLKEEPWMKEVDTII